MSHQLLNPHLRRLLPIHLVTVTLYGEARGEPVEGQIAVANVIRNRVRSSQGGRSYQDVLRKWAQFSCLWPESGGLHHQEVLDFAGVLFRDESLQGAQFLLQRQLLWIADGIMRDDLMDNTHGAQHYFAPGIMGPPRWAGPPGVRTVTIGRHEFWRGVP